MASLHRIYQGRLLHCHLQAQLDREADDLPHRHFEIFQQAINYYLFALAALETRSSGPIADLRRQMAGVWEPWIDRRGQWRSGLRTLLADPLAALKGGAVESIDEAFSLLQPESGVPELVRSAALDLLLSKCQGEGAVQQGSKSYWPRFCWQGNNPTWDLGPEAEAAEAGYLRLQQVVHCASSQDELEALARDMRLDWAGVKLNPGEFYEGAKGKARLLEAITYFEDKPGKRQQAVVSDAGEAWAQLRQRVIDLPESSVRIPGNRKAAKDLTYAALLFQFAPSDLSQQLLACSVKAPGKSIGRKKAISDLEVAAEVLGDDPIKLCRGRRGYVFPAFTALPNWEGSTLGEFAWKDFDMAAFAGALLTVNQINRKTAEREERKTQVEKVIAYMEGHSKDLRDTDFSGDHAADPPPILGDDPRYPLLMNLLESELAVKNEATEQEEVAYTLRSRTLRGFSELRERWEPVLEKRAPGVSDATLRDRLLEILHEHQKAESRTMGSAPLLTALCQPLYWSLWIRPRDLGPERAENLLEAYADLLEYRTEVERLKRPIRFTPADPVYSPRSYDFSAMTGKEKTQFLREWGRVEVSLAVREDGHIRSQRALLTFSAPRAQRDGLESLVKAKGLPWAPPVLAAFSDLPSPEVSKVAMGLMPHPSGNSGKSMVLNFPVALDVEPLQAALAAGGRWRGAFNAKSKTEFLHLYWPSTLKGASRDDAWWKDTTPFRLLSVDLGQRTAAATARLRVHVGEGRQTWELGKADGNTWWAELEGTALLRLPGEDSPVAGHPHHEREGRKATAEELAETMILIRQMGQEPEIFELEGRSFPQLNDLLLVVFRRAQGRLRQHLRWLWMLQDPDRKTKALLEISEQQRRPEWAAWAMGGKVPLLLAPLEQAVHQDRVDLPPMLLRLAERLVPLRTHRWVWNEHPGGLGAYRLEQKSMAGGAGAPRIRGQRGLSMARLEQLEELRRRCQALNRLLQREPGSAPPRPSEMRNQPMPETCQDLLDKLEEIKRQRVDQTAHLILVEALGLRLWTSTMDAESRQRRDQHGEYEPIPGREPVSMIVLEDLSRYLTSQSQGRGENSRLMKWCHRAITDKVRQLAEPFGLPVITVAPAYSSRFDSRSGVPGFRAVEVKLADKNRFPWKRDLDFSRDKPGERPRFPVEVVRAAFDALKRAETERGERGVRPPLTLLLPQGGGPIFVPATFAQPGAGARVTQADLNAAINLGLRALASPEAFHLLPRITVHKGLDGELLPRLSSKVEKARFGPKDHFLLPESEKAVDTLFAVMSPLDQHFFGKGVSCPSRPDLPMLISGRVLWGGIKHDLQWKAVDAINRARIAKWQTRGLGEILF